MWAAALVHIEGRSETRGLSARRITSEVAVVLCTSRNSTDSTAPVQLCCYSTSNALQCTVQWLDRVILLSGVQN